jgi:UDP-N-acetylglucosamine diphosphorylase/glucosamine-1-phosphate N-acetyltransferase
MTTLYLYDDARARAFEPFALTRPMAEMRAGAALIRERWMRAVQADAVQVLCGPEMRDFDEPGAARCATGKIPAGSIVANARCAPALLMDAVKARKRAATSTVWSCGGALAAVRIGKDMDADAFATGAVSVDSLAAGTGAICELAGWWVQEIWDFIRILPEQLADDLSRMAEARSLTGGATAGAIPEGVTVMGDEPVLIAGSAAIEPMVVLDASHGPIVVDAGAHVRAFTRLVGPCYIGPDVNVMGGDISVCAIGERCKVRGELSNTIIVGHSNKGHDGFVGHSYMGRWVNLGAGTITSNLKNTYGAVALWTPAGVRETGMQFLGTMFGDHAKTGIGLRLTTGTVLGAGANVYGSNMPPKAVPPFAWGDREPYATYRADKFLETAERMMSRRDVSLSDAAARHLAAAHARSNAPTVPGTVEKVPGTVEKVPGTVEKAPGAK